MTHLMSLWGPTRAGFGHWLHPVVFASRKLNNAESRYSAYERELLGIIWALGQWRHYFRRAHPIIVRNDHSPLRHLSSQNSVNTRIWELLSIMQGYHLEIQHIPGKVNPADHLSRQFISSANLIKDQARAENKKLVEQMRVPTDASDQQIQKILTEAIQRDQCPRSVQSVFSKLNFEDSSVGSVFLLSPATSTRARRLCL